jgi:hypothetical protein
MLHEFLIQQANFQESMYSKDSESCAQNFMPEGYFCSIFIIEEIVEATISHSQWEDIFFLLAKIKKRDVNLNLFLNYLIIIKVKHS